MKNIKNHPPELGQKLLKTILPEIEKQYLIGGIEEEYKNKLKENGQFLTLLWYWKELILTIPCVIFDSFKWRSVMFKNYLKIVIRIIKRKKIYSMINLSGLTIGLTSCILILLYINFELGYDKFHENADNIYRVVMRQPGNMVRGSTTDWWVVSPAILKPTWERELPEIEIIARTTDLSAVLDINGQMFDERFLVADPEFLEIFTFPLKYGDKRTALNEPFSLIITERKAKSFFGEENPLGKTISAEGGKFKYKITGVFKDIPENSHLKFDFIASFKTLKTVWRRNWDSDNWLNNPYDTYLTLQENTDLKKFDEKLRKYDLEGFSNKTWTFHVQPLLDIHFNRDIRGKGDIRYIYIFSFIGLFVLFIACFNFINLTTARSASRAKEVGIRKVVGAYKKQLLQQLLGESILFTFIAMVFSVILIYFLLPVFNSLIGKELSFNVLFNTKFILSIIGITFLVGVISGSYPAVVLSSFQPVKVMKGSLDNSTRRTLFFRNSLFVLQFAVSVIMIISTITLYYQLQFIRNKKLGYNKNHIITLRNRVGYFETFKNELSKNPDIVYVSLSSGTPTGIGWSNIPAWEGKDADDNPFFYRLTVDFDFFDLYGLEIVKGRKFSSEFNDEDGNAYILNEAAVKSLGWDDPIGKKFGFWEITGTVIGVVKDFHFETLHKQITPLGIGVKDSRNFGVLSVRINSENISNTISDIENIWKEFAPNYPFQYSFIDEQVDNLYKTEQKMALSFNYFTIIAIFIACLGLFGLASFIAEQKTKEIGIRKVLGADVSKIVTLLTKDFILLVLIANIFACPIAWYAMRKWLETFAYRIDINITFFVSAAVISLLIALGTISFQAFRAAAANPVDSLRNE
ncbi:ABC transporter permease [candidate division KSB1 bacterium]